MNDEAAAIKELHESIRLETSKMLDNGYLNEIVYILSFYVPTTVLLKGHLLINIYMDSLKQIAVQSLTQYGDKALLTAFYDLSLFRNLSTHYKNQLLHKELPDFSELIKNMYYSASFHEIRKRKMEHATLAYIYESEARTTVLLKELANDVKTQFFKFLDSQTD